MTWRIIGSIVITCPTMSLYFEIFFLQRQCIEENSIEKWKQNVNNRPVLMSYVLFKYDFNMEYYLQHVKDVKLRRSLGQLKLSSDRLAIASGHH